MAEGIEKNLWGRNNHAIVHQNRFPEVGVRPLLWLQATVDQSNGADRLGNDIVLLLTKCNSGGHKPRDLVMDENNPFKESGVQLCWAGGRILFSF